MCFKSEAASSYGAEIGFDRPNKIHFLLNERRWRKQQAYLVLPFHRYLFHIHLYKKNKFNILYKTTEFNLPYKTRYINGWKKSFRVYFLQMASCFLGPISLLLLNFFFKFFSFPEGFKKKLQANKTNL